jgi:hypothetical protein
MSCVTIQNVDPQQFATSPVLFGDYMKMRAPVADRCYEKIDLTKVRMFSILILLSQHKQLFAKCQRQICLLVFAFDKQD